MGALCGMRFGSRGPAEGDVASPWWSCLTKRAQDIWVLRQAKHASETQPSSQALRFSVHVCQSACCARDQFSQISVCSCLQTWGELHALILRLCEARAHAADLGQAVARIPHTLLRFAQWQNHCANHSATDSAVACESSSSSLGVGDDALAGLAA